MTVSHAEAAGPELGRGVSKGPDAIHRPVGKAPLLRFISARVFVQMSSPADEPFGSSLVDMASLQSMRCPMDWNRVEGNWKQLKGKVKEQWGKLTDDDLDVIAGKRDQLEGKIQERYGLEKDRVKTDVDTWYNRQTW
jgi:uncharacterized protein YjbJ (UPF0337 family)